MEDWLHILLSLLLAGTQVVLAIIAIVKGLAKRKATKNLTIAEQEKDMRKYMIDECSSVESFSKILKGAMSKQELSDYKRNTVLKNMELYAKANGYTWYNSDVWGNELTEYIKGANIVAGKVLAK